MEGRIHVNRMPVWTTTSVFQRVPREAPLEAVERINEVTGEVRGRTADALVKPRLERRAIAPRLTTVLDGLS